jgi:hypothetical protein
LPVNDLGLCPYAHLGPVSGRDPPALVGLDAVLVNPMTMPLAARDAQRPGRSPRPRKSMTRRSPTTGPCAAPAPHSGSAGGNERAARARRGPRVRPAPRPGGHHPQTTRSRRRAALPGTRRDRPPGVCGGAGGATSPALVPGHERCTGADTAPLGRHLASDGAEGELGACADGDPGEFAAGHGHLTDPLGLAARTAVGRPHGRADGCGCPRHRPQPLSSGCPGQAEQLIGRVLTQGTDGSHEADLTRAGAPSPRVGGPRR